MTSTVTLRAEAMAVMKSLQTALHWKWLYPTEPIKLSKDDAEEEDAEEDAEDDDEDDDEDDEEEEEEEKEEEEEEEVEEAF